MKRLGIVALESSHVDAYCRIFNLPDDDWHVEGARIVALCTQGNTQERIDELCTKCGEAGGGVPLEAAVLTAERQRRGP